MSTPVLHLLAGSNGAGKSTFAELVLVPITRLPFVNADLIAEEKWPGDRDRQQAGAAEVSQLAAERRDELIGQQASFITETVFSHESKLELISAARGQGYNVALHIVLLPEDLTVERVGDRVATGGHRVPEQKIRDRYRRLWALVAQARDLADRADFYDNSSSRHPYQLVASYEYGALVGVASWPPWTPSALL